MRADPETIVGLRTGIAKLEMKGFMLLRSMRGCQVTGSTVTGDG